MANGTPATFPGYARAGDERQPALATLADRVLSWAADVDGAGAARAKLRAFRTYLLLHAAVELTLYGMRWGGTGEYFALLFAGGLVLCLGLLPLPGRGSQAAAGGAAFMLGAIVWLFPGVSNHFFLIFVALAVLALLNIDYDDEAEAALRALRWITVTVLFWTGMQKVLYGSYFQAEFLTWKISKADNFADAFARVMPAGELERLRALHAGPYRTSWLPLIVASNAVWVFELFAPALLLVRRTRWIAIPAVILLFALIEAGARELLFGLLFLNMVLLFTRRNYNRPLLLVSIVVFAGMFAVRFGLLPSWFFN